MRVTGGFSNAGISNLYSALYQGKVAMHNNRLSRNLFPTNNAQGQSAFGVDALQYINDIKTASSALSGALKELSGPAFNQRTMVSSNDDVMTVNFTGKNANNVGDMSVQIDQIAMGQLNEGSRLSSSALYQGNRGTNRFAIETGGKTTQLSINVSAGDSNRDVQNKMATAINNAGLGLKATVETDSKTNVSMLRIESTNVGTAEKNAFTIRDTMGNAAAQTGAGEVSRERQDAIYSVNGGPQQTSQSNMVNLGNGVSATFKATSGGQDVKVSRGSDSSHIRSVVESMIRNYNSLFSAAAGNPSDPKAQSLASRIMNIGGAYSRALTDIGVGFDSNGRMTIDSSKLGQAIDSGRVQSFFAESGGRNFGFSANLGRLADNVSSNTSNFVSNSIFGSSPGGNMGYSGFGNLINFNSFGTGSLLDYMF